MRTTASTGATSSVSANCCFSMASWASAAFRRDSASAISSCRGPARTRSSVFCQSSCAAAPVAFGRGLGAVQFLLAYAGTSLQCHEPVVTIHRVDGFCARGFQVRSGLRHFFGAGTVAKPRDNLPLSRGLRVRLGNLRREPAGIEPGAAPGRASRDPLHQRAGR